MKKSLLQPFFTLLLALVSTTAMAGLHPFSLTNQNDHLIEVNQEWVKHQDLSNQDQIQFKSDIDRIQFHLINVIDRLSAKSVEQLSKSQAENRHGLLTELAAYAEKAVFPINRYHSSRTPYFIDHRGVHCAVGYLILQSGHGALAQEIRDLQNYAYIREIDSDALRIWADEFGFDMEELAWIQPAYAAPETFSTVGQGINGRVNFMVKSNSETNIYVTGDFDEFGDGTPSSGLAYFGANEQLVNIPFNGTINSIQPFGQTAIIASGTFQYQGQTYNQAVFDGTAANYSFAGDDALFNNMQTVWAEEDSFGSGKLIHAFRNGNQTEILFSQSTGTNSTHEMTVFGDVKEYANIEGREILVGDFDSVWVYDGVGQYATVFAENIVVLDGVWRGYSGPVPSVVKSIVPFKGMAYLAGAKSSDAHGVFMSRLNFENEDIQKVLHDSIMGTQGNVIDVLSMTPRGSDVLMVTGTFNTPGTTMIQAKHLAIYSEHEAQGQVYPIFQGIGNLNSTVTGVCEANGELYAGGNFSGNSSGDQTGQLAKMDGELGLSENSSITITLAPNPATDLVTISGLNQTETSLKVSDFSGKVWLNEVINADQETHEINVEMLPKGIYVIQLDSALKSSSLKLIVQ